MNMYQSPGGARYVVVDCRVYCRPNVGAVFLSSMTVEHFLFLIRTGMLTFVKTIKPIMLKKH